jgi:hypothetical protein
MSSPTIIDLRTPRPTLPDCRRHWLRGILAGLLLALGGLFVIWLIERAYSWRGRPATARPVQAAAHEVTIEQDAMGLAPFAPLPPVDEIPIEQEATEETEPASLFPPLPPVRSPSPVGIDANGPANHGEEITVDLPIAQHQTNISVKGLGCCVFRSIDHAARYQNVPALMHFPEWMRQNNIPGGGYPEKVAKLIPQIARDRGLPVPDYIQHTGGDMEFLRLALGTGRFVCVTYDGRDGVFHRGPISHMVNLVHLSDKWAVILDNNYPGKYLWMTPAEFESRWKGGGGGWAIVLLAPPPPPVPVSR